MHGHPSQASVVALRHALLRCVLLLVCAVAVVPMLGQNLIFTASGGVTKLGGEPSRNVGAFKIGAGVEIELSQTLTIEPRLLYAARGWKDYDYQLPDRDLEGRPVVDEYGNPRYANVNTTTAANYLALPVLAHYYIPMGSGKGLFSKLNTNYLVLTAGPYAAVGVGGNRRTSGDPTQPFNRRHYYDDPTFKLDGMKRLDVGLTIGIGFEFNRTISAGIETDLGLTRVNSDGGRHRSLMLTLAYRLDFDR